MSIPLTPDTKLKDVCAGFPATVTPREDLVLKERIENRSGRFVVITKSSIDVTTTRPPEPAPVQFRGPIENFAKSAL